MQPPVQLQSQTSPLPNWHFRVNVTDLKSRIAKRLGPDRAMRYFRCLNGLLSQKLSKSEFNKLCSQILGKDNLSLHNQLIRSILHNAYQAKAPPPVVNLKDSPRPNGFLLKKSFRIEDRFNSLEAPGPPVQTFANGHVMPPSPQKQRSGLQNHTVKDQLRALGPNGRIETSSYLPAVPYGEAVLRENGDSGLHDSKRSVRHQHGTPAEHSVKKPKVEKESVLEVVGGTRDDREHHNDLTNSRGPLRAPLGVPFFTVSIGGAHRSRHPADRSSCSSYFSSHCGTGELCETEVLKKRMEKIAEAQGLEGVSMDCANLLNNGLDAYLKRLITTCVELVGSRSTHRPLKQPVSELQSHGKPINGVRMGNHIQILNTSVISEGNHESKRYAPITMQDLLVAIELKPHQLGEDWPLLLEKLCLSSFEK